EAEPGVTLRPLSARGLAWVDPASVIAEPPRPRAETDDPRGSLAWRWTTPDAEAKVVRDRVLDAPRASIRETATVAMGRLRLDWRIAMDAGGESLRSLPLVVSGPPVSPPEWRLIGDEDGPMIVTRPLTAARMPSPWRTPPPASSSAARRSNPPAPGA